MTDVDTEKNLKLKDGELQGKESSQEVAQTLTVIKTEKNTTEKKNYVLITKHGDEQCEETLNKDMRTMADKGTGKNAVEKKLNVDELQSEESFQTMMGMKTDEKNNVLKRKLGDQQETFKEEIETQKGDSEEPNACRVVDHAIRMMKALHGSNSDDDYAVFENLKGDFDDHFRELLFGSGAIGSTEATMECGKKETQCVIQSLAKRVIKDLELTFFGSDIEYDPFDDLDIRPAKSWNAWSIKCASCFVCTLLKNQRKIK